MAELGQAGQDPGDSGQVGGVDPGPGGDLVEVRACVEVEEERGQPPGPARGGGDHHDRAVRSQTHLYRLVVAHHHDGPGPQDGADGVPGGGGAVRGSVGREDDGVGRW